MAFDEGLLVGLKSFVLSSRVHFRNQPGQYDDSSNYFLVAL